jgi:hypothetical protein
MINEKYSNYKHIKRKKGCKTGVKGMKKIKDKR